MVLVYVYCIMRLALTAVCLDSNLLLLRSKTEDFEVLLV